VASSFETYAYFFVRDFDCDHTEISNRLGFQPTEAKNSNEALPSGRSRKTSIWHLESPLPRDTVFVSEHLEALLPLLEVHAERIAKVNAEFTTGLQCVGYYCGEHPGFHLSAELIQRVSALGLSIDFDLYCLEEDDEAQLPQFTITEVDSAGTYVGDITGTMVGEQRWIGDKDIGYLTTDLNDHAAYVRGCWSEPVGGSNTGWRFTPAKLADLNQSVSTFSVDETLHTLDVYWGERAIVCLNSALTWNEKTWIDPADHDHCFLCWATISATEGSLYFDSSDIEVACENCFQQHVVKKDLSFLPKP